MGKGIKRISLWCQFFEQNDFFKLELELSKVETDPLIDILKQSNQTYTDY